jgi:hypothetical protein
MISTAFKDPEDCVDPVAVASTKSEGKAAGGHGVAPKDAATPAKAAAEEAPPAKSGH